jgi:hypothetical protein
MGSGIGKLTREVEVKDVRGLSGNWKWVIGVGGPGGKWK